MTKQQYSDRIKNLLPLARTNEAIGAAVTTIFSEMVSMDDYQFMLAPSPLSFSITTAGVEQDFNLQQTLDKIAFIQVLGASDTAYTPIDNVLRDEFQRIRVGDIVNESQGQVWTYMGKNANNTDKFAFYPALATTDTVEIVYFMKPDDNTISRMSDKWAPVLIHGALAMLATGQEHAMFASDHGGQYREGLSLMQVREPIATDIKTQYLVDEMTAARMIENVGFQ